MAAVTGADFSGSLGNRLVLVPIIGGLRTFAIAATSKTLLNTIFALFSVREPANPKGSLLSRDNVWDALGLGLFLGGYSFISKMALSVLEKGLTGGKSSPLVSFAAGSLAGVSLVWAGNRERRQTIASYLFVQSLTYLAADLVKRGWLPAIPGIDIILFMLTNAVIMHAYVAEPESLPSGYGRWVVKMGPIDRRALEVAKHLLHSQPYPPEVMDSFCRTYGVPVPQPPLGRIDCRLFHPGRTSCTQVAVTLWLNRFFKSMIYYAPLTIFRLVSALRAKGDERTEKLKSWFIILVRLASFLATYLASYQGTACLEANCLAHRPTHRYTYGYIGAVASLSIMLAPANSRPDISFWMIPRALQTLNTSLKTKQKIPLIPGGDVILFSLSAGLLFMYWHHKTQLLSPSVRNVLDFLFQR